MNYPGMKKLVEESPDNAIRSSSGSVNETYAQREFLDEMRRVVPWSRLIVLVEPHYPTGKTGRPPFPIATMLQIHFM